MPPAPVRFERARGAGAVRADLEAEDVVTLGKLLTLAGVERPVQAAALDRHAGLLIDGARPRGGG